VPLLHLHGADDGCIEFAMSEGEESYFEGDFDNRLLPGLGHFLHLEDPRQIADAIVKFIDERGRRRSEVDDLLARVK
jgi:pimeloyl-ACP methyl ester carboxylesterase